MMKWIKLLSWGQMWLDFSSFLTLFIYNYIEIHVFMLLLGIWNLQFFFPRLLAEKMALMMWQSKFFTVECVTLICTQQRMNGGSHITLLYQGMPSFSELFLVQGLYLNIYIAVHRAVQFVISSYSRKKGFIMLKVHIAVQFVIEDETKNLHMFLGY